MDMLNLPGHLYVPGNLLVGGSKPAYARSELAQDDNGVYVIPMTWWRVWDALQTNLPGAGASDDLGLISGTFGVGTPSLQTGDVKAAGAVARYARCQYPLPPEYVAGQSVTLRAHAGMLTTISDTTATVDFEVYKSNREALQTGGDLCAIAAQTIRSLVLADKDFTITPNTLFPGDVLDIRVAIATNDAATGTAVIGVIGAVELLLDVKG
jgi:hypothetical protein